MESFSAQRIATFRTISFEWLKSRRPTVAKYTASLGTAALTRPVMRRIMVMRKSRNSAKIERLMEFLGKRDLKSSTQKAVAIVKSSRYKSNHLYAQVYNDLYNDFKGVGR